MAAAHAAGTAQLERAAEAATAAGAARGWLLHIWQRNLALSAQQPTPGEYKHTIWGYWQDATHRACQGAARLMAAPDAAHQTSPGAAAWGAGAVLLHARARAGHAAAAAACAVEGAGSPMRQEEQRTGARAAAAEPRGRGFIWGGGCGWPPCHPCMCKILSGLGRYSSGRVTAPLPCSAPNLTGTIGASMQCTEVGQYM